VHTGVITACGTRTLLMSFARATTPRLVHSENDQNDADDRDYHPDVEPVTIARHETAGDQVCALSCKHCSDDKSNHPDDDHTCAPHTAIHISQRTLDRFRAISTEDVEERMSAAGFIMPL
jgi:hypothetical protein